MTADAKNFHLNTTMKDPEYIRISIKLIPNEIREEYKTIEFEHDRYVYVQINKGMYGLAQAGLLVNEILAKQLAKHGFTQTQHTPGL